MKTSLAIILLSVFTINSVSAQVSAKTSDSLKQKNFTRSEIRQILLQTNSSSAAFRLAQKSKQNTTCSAVLYTTAGIFILGGVVAPVERNRLKNKSSNSFTGGVDQINANGIAIVCFTNGAGLVVSGVITTLFAQRYLDRAIQSYQNK